MLACTSVSVFPSITTLGSYGHVDMTDCVPSEATETRVVVPPFWREAAEGSEGGATNQGQSRMAGAATGNKAFLPQIITSSPGREKPTPFPEPALSTFPSLDC